MHNYRELRVWQAARDLAVSTYGITSGFPKGEMYGLTAQMRRSSVSIAANLAEGAGRGTVGDFARFVRIATGSAFEFETQVIIAERVGLVDAVVSASLHDDISAIKRMLYGLATSLTS